MCIYHSSSTTTARFVSDDMGDNSLGAGLGRYLGVLSLTKG